MKRTDCRVSRRAPRSPVARPSSRRRRRPPSPKLRRRPPKRRAGAQAGISATFGFDKAGMDRDRPRRATISTATPTAPGRRPRRSRPTSRTTACSPCSTICRASAPATIIEEAAKDPNSKIGAAYASFLDKAAIEAKGLAPFEPWLNEVRGLKSKARACRRSIAEADRMGIGTPFAGFVSQDDKDARPLYPELLPGRHRHAGPRLLSVERSQARRDARQVSPASDQHADACGRSRMPRPAPRRSSISKTKIAKVHWTAGRKPRRDQDLQQDDASPQLAKRAPGFDFASRCFKATRRQGVEVDDRRPAERDHRHRRAGRKAPLGSAQGPAAGPVARRLFGLPAKAFDKENFAFYGTTLSRHAGAGSALEAGGQLHRRRAADDVSKLYVERYFPPETKAAADELVQERHRRDGPADRQARLDEARRPRSRRTAKLAAFTPKIGYPSQWRDYSSLEIDRGDLLGNAMRVEPNSTHADNVSKLGEADPPVGMGHDPDDDQRLCQFRHGRDRLPGRDPAAAVLRSATPIPAINYGGIGAVIGHEISHHFDDQGAKYDENGRLADWWTPEDVEGLQALPASR